MMGRLSYFDDNGYAFEFGAPFLVALTLASNTERWEDSRDAPFGSLPFLSVVYACCSFRAKH